MICPICNAQNNEDAKVCAKCGARLDIGPEDFQTDAKETDITGAEKPASDKIEPEATASEAEPENPKPENIERETAAPEKVEPGKTEPEKIELEKPAPSGSEPERVEPRKIEPEPPKQDTLEMGKFEPKKPEGKERKKEPPKAAVPEDKALTEEQADNKQTPVKPAEKMNKGPKIILTVLLVLVLLIGGFYVFFTREFYQLILSDSKYNQYLFGTTVKGAERTVIDKLSDRMTQQYAYSFDAGVNIELGNASASLMPEGTSTFATSVIDYLNSLRFKGDMNVVGLDSEQKVEVIDNNGTLITVNAIQDGSVNYIKISEISDKWFKLSDNNAELDDATKLIKKFSEMTDEKKQLKSSVTDLTRTFLSIYDKGKIEITGGQTLKVGSVSVKGDKSSVTFTAAQLKAALEETAKQAKNDTALYNTLKAYFDEAVKTSDAFAKMVKDGNIKFDEKSYKKYINDFVNDIVGEIEASKLQTLTVDQYINRRNKIVGVKVTFDSKDKDSDMVFSYINNRKAGKPQRALQIRPIDDKLAKKDYVRIEQIGENRHNGTVTANVMFDGDGGKMIVSYKDIKTKDNYLLGQINASFSGFDFDASMSSFLNSLKITYKSEMADKTQKVKLTMDAGDYGKIVLDTKAKSKEVSKISAVKSSIPVLDSNGDFTSEFDSEVDTGFTDFFLNMQEKHTELMALQSAYEAMLESMFSSILSDEDYSDYYDDEDYSDYYDDEDYSDFSGLSGTDYSSYMPAAGKVIATFFLAG